MFTAASRNEIDKDIDYFRERARHFTQQKEWTKASVYFEKIMGQHPQSPIDFEESQEWMRMAALLVMAGDREKYDRLCKDMLIRFDHMLNPVIAERIIKTSLILPPNDATRKRALELAKLATSDPDHWVMPWAITSRALADFRAANYESALSRLDQGAPSSANWGIKGYAHLVRAMSEHHLGNMTATKESLRKADALFDMQSEDFSNKDVSNYGLPNNWHDWLFLQALRKEAGELIEGDSAVAASRATHQ